MKAIVILLFVFCYVDCRKIVPIDKNANLAFINMEGGGGARPNSNSKPVAPVAPAAPAPAPASTVSKPTSPTASPQAKLPSLTPTATLKPVIPNATPAKPVNPQPSQIQPKPVNPAPVSNPITTPGPGSVKQLVNFYDSQGKASPIRPYSYSQAVKQG